MARVIESLYWEEKNAKIYFLWSDLHQETIIVFPDSIKDYIGEYLEWFGKEVIYLRSEIDFFVSKKPSPENLRAIHAQRKKDMKASLP